MFCSVGTALGEFKKRAAEDPLQFSELPRKLIRMDPGLRVSKVYAGCVEEVCALVEDNDKKSKKLAEVTAEKRHLKSCVQAADLDEAIDGQVVYTLRAMLKRDGIVTDHDIMKYVFETNRESWTEDRVLLPTISLSITDFFDKIGAGSLSQFNDAWNAANPEVAPAAAVPPPAGLAVLVDGVAQGPILALPVGGVTRQSLGGVLTRASARVSASGSSDGSSGGGTLEAGMRRGEAMAEYANDGSSGGSLT